MAGMIKKVFMRAKVTVRVKWALVNSPAWFQDCKETFPLAQVVPVKPPGWLCRESWQPVGHMSWPSSVASGAGVGPWSVG